MVRKSKMAELAPSTLQPWFLQQSEHISPRKTPVFMSIQLQSINSCFSIKINSLFDKLTKVVQQLAFRRFGISVVRPPWGTNFFVPFFSLFNYFKKTNNFQQWKKIGAPLLRLAKSIYYELASSVASVLQTIFNCLLSKHLVPGDLIKSF